MSGATNPAGNGHASLPNSQANTSSTAAAPTTSSVYPPPQLFINTAAAQAGYVNGHPSPSNNQVASPNTPPFDTTHHSQTPSLGYRRLLERLRHLNIPLSPTLYSMGLSPGEYIILPNGDQRDTRVASIETPTNSQTLVSILRPGPAPGPKSPYASLKIPALLAMMKSRGLRQGPIRRKAAYIATLEQGTAGFRIMDLAPEIRDMIFKLVLCERKTLWTLDPRLCSQPALTRVSRDIRAETLPIFYGYNRFALGLEILFNRNTRGFVSLHPATKAYLAAIDKQVYLLQKIQLELVIGSRAIVLGLDLGSRKKTEEHMRVSRTCGYHSALEPRCRRWKRSQKTEEVFAGVQQVYKLNDREEEFRDSVENIIYMLIEDEMRFDFKKGVMLGFNAEAVEGFSVAIGEVLNTNRKYVP